MPKLTQKVLDELAKIPPPETLIISIGNVPTMGGSVVAVWDTTTQEGTEIVFLPQWGKYKIMQDDNVLTLSPDEMIVLAQVLAAIVKGQSDVP